MDSHPPQWLQQRFKFNDNDDEDRVGRASVGGNDVEKTFSWHLLSRKRARDGVVWVSFGWFFGRRKWKELDGCSLEKRRCATVLDEDCSDVGWALARLAFPLLSFPMGKGSWLTDERAFSFRLGESVGLHWAKSLSKIKN